MTSLEGGKWEMEASKILKFVYVQTGSKEMKHAKKTQEKIEVSISQSYKNSKFSPDLTLKSASTSPFPSLGQKDSETSPPYVDCGTRRNSELPLICRMWDLEKFRAVPFKKPVELTKIRRTLPLCTGFGTWKNSEMLVVFSC